MARALSNVTSFITKEKTFADFNIVCMLHKLREQEKKLMLLQRSLAEEQRIKENLRVDFEHLLGQLQVLQNK